MEFKSTEYNPLKSIGGMTNFFIVCGLWPTATRFRWLYTIYSFIFHLMFYVLYVYCKFMNFIFETNMALLTVGFFIFLAELSLCIRIVNLMAHFGQVMDCVKMIRDFRIYNKKEVTVMNKHLSSFSTIMKWYMGSGTSACIFSWSAPLFSTEPMLPYPSWYPFDWRNDQQSYWMLYAYQVVTVSFHASTIILLQLLPVYFLAVIGAQFDILKCRLESLGRLDTNMFQKIAEFELINCVVVHNEILRFTRLVENIFTTQFLFQFVTTSAVFCLAAYRIALMSIADELFPFIFYISFCMVFLFEIFLACYFGNEIILSNTMLSFALYSSNWINLSLKFKKNMVMFLEALKRPTMLKTGKIFKLTLESFLIVINRSYSLFAVLQNTIN